MSGQEMAETATDLRGIVHNLTADGMTVCGQDTIGWSRTVTELQRMGLVIFCEACHE